MLWAMVAPTMIMQAPSILLICLLIGRCFSLVVPSRSLTGLHKQQLFMTENACFERTSVNSAVLGGAIQMTPLSSPPLLLLQSSTPIISKDQCETLINYFDHISTTGDAGHSHDATQIEYATSLLEEVKGIIDNVSNCPRHDGESMLPRYVRYKPQLINEETLFDPKKLRDALLPDGCHVDTNNGKLFRHITAILYLTDNLYDDSSFGGGTSFPLAKPWTGRDASYSYEKKDRALLGSAARLLERNMHHTKADKDISANSDGRRLEMAGIDAFTRDHANNYAPCNTMGVRVMPKAGSLIFFHNINDDGNPDPTSFHGGEELISILSDQQFNHGAAKTKNILVFFKEVPIDSFSDMNGFIDCVAKARRWTRNTYYH